MVQLVKNPLLNFSSDLDLRALSSNLVLGSMMGMEPTYKKKKN